MSAVLDFILQLFGKTTNFVSNCKFFIYDYEVNLFGVFLVLIVLSVLITIFFKGGKY